MRIEAWRTRVSVVALACACLILSGCDDGVPSGYGYHTGGRHRHVPPRRHDVPYEERMRERMLETVRRGEGYRKKRVLNATERRVFAALVSVCQENGWRVLPQVSMGQIVASDDEKEWMAVRGLVPDFCVTDKDFVPLAIVEVNGEGHDPKNDRRKKILCKKIGMAYVEVPPTVLAQDPKQVRNHLSQTLASRIANPRAPSRKRRKRRQGKRS